MDQKISPQHLGNEVANQKKYPFSLPDLPYGKKDLEPHMTEETFDYHHGKHHNAYVQNLNKLLADNSMNSLSLEEIMIESGKDSSKVGIFNNAAQIWNHTFFWHSMKPNGGGKPSGDLFDQIEKDFGSYEDFIDKMKIAGATQFGSGWAWLVYNVSTKALEVVKTANADNPMTQGLVPMLACDVWEHAYYIDYQNKRPDYINAFLEHLVNWDFAEEIFNKLHK
ncbi:MAG: superoxide dismutase [Alphaproteobacteria bacterium]|nr:superoxide dismutase [Alphaproteobacteria bacterium]